MVLGTLASAGPRHGHDIRRMAEVTNVANWGGISVGALYRDLRAMENEGLVTPVRTEQVGRRPARTVYKITDKGLEALRELREEAICEIHHGPDAFAVALLFGRTSEPATLVKLLERRREALAAVRDGIAGESVQLYEEGLIGILDVAMFHRRIMLLDTELQWHDELDKVIAELSESTDSPAQDAEETYEHTEETGSS